MTLYENGESTRIHAAKGSSIRKRLHARWPTALWTGRSSSSDPGSDRMSPTRPTGARVMASGVHIPASEKEPGLTILQ